MGILRRHADFRWWRSRHNGRRNPNLPFCVWSFLRGLPDIQNGLPGAEMNTIFNDQTPNSAVGLVLDPATQFLLYCNTRSAVKTMIVVMAVRFSAGGALWMTSARLQLEHRGWASIALLGIDAETGVFMLLYLRPCV